MDSLSADAIIDAAESIAQREGVDAVSLRRIGTELGVTAAAMYWHIKDKQALVSALVDRASARAFRPSTEFGNWLDRLIAFYLSVRDEFTMCPGLSRALMSAEPTEATMVNCLYVYEALREAGFDETDAILLFDTLSMLSWGHLMMIDMARASARQTRDEAISEFALHVRDLLATSPAYAAFAASLSAFDDGHSRHQFARGIELMIRGAAADKRVKVPRSARAASAV